MSVSGYVPEQYTVSIFVQGNAAGQHPYESIVEKVAIFALIKDKEKEECEIKVPCIIKRKYIFSFTLKRQELEDYLPRVINSTNTTIELYRGTQEKSTHEPLTSCIKPKSPTVITNTIISGEFCLKIADDFSTTKTGCFIYIAVKIHDVVIKYLACEIAVYTNTCQISPNYDLVIQDRSQLKNLFWHQYASFIKKAESTKLKMGKKVQKSIEEIPEEKRPLFALLQATNATAEKIKALLESDEPYTKNALFEIASPLIATYQSELNPTEIILEPGNSPTDSRETSSTTLIPESYKQEEPPFEIPLPSLSLIFPNVFLDEKDPLLKPSPNSNIAHGAKLRRSE